MRLRRRKPRYGEVYRDSMLTAMCVGRCKDDLYAWLVLDSTSHRYTGRVWRFKLDPRMEQIT